VVNELPCAFTVLVGHQQEHPACKILSHRWGAGMVICLEQGANGLRVV